MEYNQFCYVAKIVCSSQQMISVLRYYNGYFMHVCMYTTTWILIYFN